MLVGAEAVVENGGIINKVSIVARALSWSNDNNSSSDGELTRLCD